MRTARRRRAAVDSIEQQQIETFGLCRKTLVSSPKLGIAGTAQTGQQMAIDEPGTGAVELVIAHEYVKFGIGDDLQRSEVEKNLDRFEPGGGRSETSHADLTCNERVLEERALLDEAEQPLVWTAQESDPD